MAYTPINLGAFTSAYAGAISGMAVSGWITDPNQADYLLVSQIAGAFAQAFDQAWNNGTGLTVLEELAVVTVCQNQFANRGPGPLANPLFQRASFWAVPASACVALVLEGDAYFLSQSIVSPPAGGGAGATTVLVEPTIAALSAINVTSLQNGQPATVQSNGSLWSLTPIGTLTVDGITVASSPNPARVWQRWGSYAPENYQAQLTWFVDPIAGNDEASGVDAAHPVQHKAEIYRRWGNTWAPSFDAIGVVITYLQGEVEGMGSGNDPGLFAPTFINGARLTQQGALPAPGFTGTLNVVTAKNRATNSALHATFTATTGAIAVGMLLVNATRGNSRAFVSKDLGAGSFLLTQPLTPYVIASSPVSQSEVDTWAHGDAISGYTLLAVDLPLIGGTASGFAVDFGGSHVVSQLRIIDPQGFGESVNLTPSSAFICVDVRLQRGPSVAGQLNTQSSYFLGCLAIDLPTFVSTNAYNGIFARGGAFDTIAAPIGLGMTLDAQILTSLTVGSATLGTAYLPTGAQFIVDGGLTSVSGPAYGAFGLNLVGAGTLGYTAPAATSLVGAAGLQIGGASSVYGNNTTGSSTATNRIALSLSALDAAKPGGFAGLAYVPGIGAITSGGVTP